MKRFYLVSAVVIAALATFSCKPAEDPKEEIPALINASLTTLTNDGITAGTPNILNVSATGEGTVLTIKFYSDKIYLPNASYTIGTANGNYTAHYKDSYVDSDVASGTLTASSDENSNYTLSGSLRLNNEQGTVVKINVTGLMEYELPSEYCYVQSSEGGATVYDIYTLGDENEHVAKATVFGETGTFAVNGSKQNGSALYGCCATTGSFFKKGNDGYFMALSGNITVQKKAGKLNFTFDGARDTTFNNCEKVTSVNKIVNKPVGPIAASSYLCKYCIVESEIAPGAYEFTEKTFFPDGSEFISITLLLSNTTITGKNLHGPIVGYDQYTEDKVDETDENVIAIGPACYYFIDGEPVLIDMSGSLYGMINASYESAGIGFALPLTANLTLPTDLFNYLKTIDPTATDPMMATYNLLGALIQ